MKHSTYRFVFLAAICGNILEYFDFTLYSIFLSQIGHTFFPTGSEFTQVISALLVFAIGFVARPVGGIFFGYLGDSYGRKFALIISILGMTVPTVVIGLIPKYDDIGIAAPILLALMRLTQGLCLAGEGAGTAIFVLEHQHQLKPGLVTSLVHASNTIGMLLANLVGLIVISKYNHIDYAWRAAFLLGGLVGILGLYIRLKVSETPIFMQLVKQKNVLRSPLVNVMRSAKIQMIVTFFIAGLTSSVVYLVKNVNGFYRVILEHNDSSSLYHLLYTTFFMMICIPIFGALSDYYGRAKVIIYSAITILISAIPIFWLMSSSDTTSQILGMTGLAMLAGSTSGVSYIFVISLFTPEQRFSGVGFSFNLGNAVFGGSAPALTTFFSKTVSQSYNSNLGNITPAFYIMFTSSLFLLVMYLSYGSIKKYIK